MGAVARGLGFREEDFDRSLRKTFSGGEITRASLARSLAGDPDPVLLDEPTNHLDVASLEWLERELALLDAACVIVAHDRWFLEAVTNATLGLEAGRAAASRARGVWRLERPNGPCTPKTADHRGVRHRAPRALRGPLPIQEKNKAEQARSQADADRAPDEGTQLEAGAEAGLLTRRTRSLGFDFEP